MKKKDMFTENEGYNASLSHDFIELTDGNRNYYGGSQNMYDTPKERSCGCGIAGAADVILYLEAVNTGNFTVEKEKFMELSRLLRKKYIPIIPGRGVNAFLMARGMNRYFKKNGLPYHSYWKCTSFRKWQITERMLKNDIPVIIAIGNNFPMFWGKKELNLYVRDEQATDSEEVYKKEQSVCGHFVVITSIKGNCLTVSSWGRRYFISIDEFNKYVFRHSTHMYSNILAIKRKKIDC